ncbi:NmrA-like family protein [Aspergillus pseudodeflectus]|uniref:NmrA-like family protein n=1 Tax=Aspergillus pseudodeflectus TaxID=176178 RepID=A0ABR4JYL7_9EURO
MTPSILIVGATGNTGRAVTQTLPKLLQSPGNPLSGHRILALTRSRTSPVATELAKLPGVEVIEQNWVEITADWLRSHHVTRAFIASHNAPNQFAEESTFHLNALTAGVEYVVRISTTAANVRPDCPAYYPRQHWAIEALLASPEFANLHWTSLQPNVFSQFVLAPAAELIKQYRKTGEQSTLRLILAEDAPVGIIDSNEVGVVAAHLLAQADISVHNGAKYVLNGPEDTNGKKIVEMVEEYIGVPVRDVSYKDVSFIEMLYEYQYAATGQSRNVIYSIKRAPETSWEGLTSAATTSKEVLQIAAPKRTPAEVLKTLLEG